MRSVDEGAQNAPVERRIESAVVGRHSAAAAGADENNLGDLLENVVLGEEHVEVVDHVFHVYGVAVLERGHARRGLVEAQGDEEEGRVEAGLVRGKDRCGRVGGDVERQRVGVVDEHKGIVRGLGGGATEDVHEAAAGDVGVIVRQRVCHVRRVNKSRASAREGENGAGQYEEHARAQHWRCV